MEAELTELCKVLEMKTAFLEEMEHEEEWVYEEVDAGLALEACGLKSF